MGGPNQFLFDLKCDHHKIWLKDKRFAERADFTGRTLSGLNAKYLDLTGAIFTDAFIDSCDFTNANLSEIHAAKVHFNRTDLSGASFKNAYLRDAKFTETTFDDTDLWNVSGDGVYIISLQLGGRYVCYTSDILQIGCQQFDISKIWWMHDDDILAKAGTGHAHASKAEMAAWWAKWKHQIYQIANSNPAKPVTRGK